MSKNDALYKSTFNLRFGKTDNQRLGTWDLSSLLQVWILWNNKQQLGHKYKEKGQHMDKLKLLIK